MVLIRLVNKYKSVFEYAETIMFKKILFTSKRKTTIIICLFLSTKVGCGAIPNMSDPEKRSAFCKLSVNILSTLYALMQITT